MILPNKSVAFALIFVRPALKNALCLKITIASSAQMNAESALPSVGIWQTCRLRFCCTVSSYKSSGTSLSNLKAEGLVSISVDSSPSALKLLVK